MRMATFDIILDQLKRKRDQELTILIETQKQDVFRSNLVAKNQEINELKRTKAGFPKSVCHTFGKSLKYGYFLKTLNKKLTEYRCEQLLKRVLELERMALSQEKVIFETAAKNKEIIARIKEKQIQLKALLVVLASILFVAAVLLKAISYLLE